MYIPVPVRPQVGRQPTLRERFSHHERHHRYPDVFRLWERERTFAYQLHETYFRKRKIKIYIPMKISIRNEKSRTPKPEIPFENEKFRMLNY